MSGSGMLSIKTAKDSAGRDVVIVACSDRSAREIPKDEGGEFCAPSFVEGVRFECGRSARYRDAHHPGAYCPGGLKICAEGGDCETAVSDLVKAGYNARAVRGEWEV